MVKFGERLKDEILRTGKSQNTVAKESGVSSSRLSDMISNPEKAKRGITAENLIKLAKYFDCSTDWLLGLEDVRTQPAKSVIMNEAISLVENDTHVYTDVYNDFPTARSIT